MMKAKLSQLAKLSPLQLLLLSLAALASAASIKAMVWPVWPRIDAQKPKLIIAALHDAGFEPHPSGTKPAKRSTEMASSTIYRYNLGQGHVLTFFRGRAKQRFNFQASFLSRADESLRIKNRTIDTATPVSSSGMVNRQHLRQTCLVQGYQFPNGFGVTREQLTQLADAKSSGMDKQALYIVGLASNRDYDCTLISLSSDDAAVDNTTWNRLLKAFQAGFEQGDHR